MIYVELQDASCFFGCHKISQVWHRYPIVFHNRFRLDKRVLIYGGRKPVPFYQ